MPPNFLILLLLLGKYRNFHAFTKARVFLAKIHYLESHSCERLIAASFEIEPLVVATCVCVTMSNQRVCGWLKLCQIGTQQIT